MAVEAIVPPADDTASAGRAVRIDVRSGLRTNPFNHEETDMSWETPKATDLRFGFEITMYVANR